MAAETKLKVMEALQEEAYKGIVRIDAETMNSIGVRPGDIVEIEGQRITVGIVDRAYPTDVGQAVIRMDGILRRNAKTGIGDFVNVRKADVKEAKSIQIAPAQKGVMVQADPELFKRALLGRALIKGDIVSPGGTRRRKRAMSGNSFEEIFDVFEQGFMGNFGLGGLKFIVVNTNPKSPVIITEQTEISISTKAVEILEEKVPDVTYEDIGGLDEEIKKIREMVELPLKHPEIFARLGIDPPAGVLLHGPPGSGKTLLAKAVANESEANFMLINGPEVVNKFYGESEKRIRDIFEEAEKNSPAIIFIDEIDSIAPKREEVHGEVERRMVSTLLCLHPDTPVYLQEEPKEIKELFEITEGKIFTNEDGVTTKIPKEQIYVQGMSPDGKITTTKVISLTKTDITDAYKVKLENGCEIITSEITRFLSIDNNGVGWKFANKLTDEDYVFVPRKLSTSESIQEINLFKLKDKGKWILKVIPGGILNRIFGRKHVSLKELHLLENENKVSNEDIRFKIINLLLDKKASDKSSVERYLGVSRHALNNYLRPIIRDKIIIVNGQNISLNITINNIEREILSICYKKDEGVFLLKDEYFLELPKIIDENFAKFLGLVISDGHVCEKGVKIAGETAKMAQELAKILFNRNLNIQKDTKGLDNLWVYSKALSMILDEYFKIPLGKKSYKVSVPEGIYSSPKSVKSAFLAGLLDGDGTIYDGVKFSTMSRKLSYGISRLLLELGIISRIRKYNTYRVDLFGGYETYQNFSDNVLRYIKIPRKRHYLQKLTTRLKQISTIRYPVKEKLKELRDKHHVRLDDNKYRYLSPSIEYNINSNVLGYMLHQFKDINDQFVYELRKIHNSDAIPCRVISVEKMNGGTMYDLTTEFSNFLAGEMPVVVHNTSLDGLKSRGKVIVIAATNRPNSIDPALRRPGRFDREITIGVPNKKGRLNILKIHTRNMPLAKDVKLQSLADITHGFVGADMQALCKEAAMNVLRRVLPELKLQEKEPLSNEILENLKVTNDDFKDSLRIVRPSALREVLIEIPDVSWNDIGGLEKQKQELKESIELPLKNPQVFKRLGIKPPKGLLMYGPPGTGKTLLAKAVAKEAEANFINVKAVDIISMWVGQSEKGIQKIFEKARQVAPTIIFFDEIDSIAPRRGIEMGAKITERLVNTLLSEMDGLEELNDIVIVAATNRPDMLDPALLRPGRFDRILYMPPPEQAERLEIFKIHTKNMPLAKDVNIEKLSEKTEGYVGADITAVCREAALLSLRDDINAKEVSKKYFEDALKKVRPSVSKEAIESYKAIEEEYFSKAKSGLAKDIPNYLG